MEGRDIVPGNDAFIMTIRRVQLGAMSGKAINTISGHCHWTMKMVRNAERINKTPNLEPRGPFPLQDKTGMGLAVDIIQESLVAKSRTEEVAQAETLRQLRSTYTNNW